MRRAVFEGVLICIPLPQGGQGGRTDELPPLDDELLLLDDEDDEPPPEATSATRPRIQSRARCRVAVRN